MSWSQFKKQSGHVLRSIPGALKKGVHVAEQGLQLAERLGPLMEAAGAAGASSGEGFMGGRRLSRSLLHKRSRRRRGRGMDGDEDDDEDY